MRFSADTGPLLLPGGGSRLAEFLLGRLARFKMPRRLHFTNDPLPKTGTGKILKRQLREALWTGKDRRIQG
jgi:acyl-CoA synthetase (AMP-forming)/AMP-acid ligase II